MKKNKPGAGRPIKKWPKQRIALLKKLYPSKTNEKVAKKLKTTVSAIRNAATRFKIKKSNRYWDKPWEDYVRSNWSVMSGEEIVHELKRKFKVEKTRWSVINKYRELTGKRQVKKPKSKS